MARLLTFFTIRTGDPKYFDAFAESYAGSGATMLSGYGTCASTFLYLPWLQARLWNARLTEHGVEIDPRHWGPRTPATGRIMTPKSEVEVSWSADGKPVVERKPPIAVTVRAGS